MTPMRGICLAGGIVIALIAPPVEARTITVTIEKLEFRPAKVTASVGDRIEWINNDVMAHTATVKDGFDVTIAPHGRASIDVGKPGEFDYLCRFHPNMRGTIDVTVP